MLGSGEGLGEEAAAQVVADWEEDMAVEVVDWVAWEGVGTVEVAVMAEGGVDLAAVERKVTMGGWGETQVVVAMVTAAVAVEWVGVEVDWAAVADEEEEEA